MPERGTLELEVRVVRPDERSEVDRIVHTDVCVAIVGEIGGEPSWTYWFCAEECAAAGEADEVVPREELEEFWADGGRIWEDD